MKKECEHLQTWDKESFYCNKERRFLNYDDNPCENCKWIKNEIQEMSEETDPFPEYLR